MSRIREQSVVYQWHLIRQYPACLASSFSCTILNGDSYIITNIMKHQDHFQQFELSYTELQKRRFSDQVELRNELTNQERKFNANHRDLLMFPMTRIEIDNRTYFQLPCCQCTAHLCFVKALNSEHIKISGATIRHRHRIIDQSYESRKKAKGASKEIEEWLTNKSRIKFRIFKDWQAKIEAFVFATVWNIKLFHKYPESIYLQSAKINALLPDHLNRILIMYTYGQRCQVIMIGCAVYTRKQQVSVLVDAFLSLIEKQPVSIITNIRISPNNVVLILNGGLIIRNLERLFDHYQINDVSIIDLVKQNINQQSELEGIKQLNNLRSAIKSVDNSHIRGHLQKVLKALMQENLCYWKLPKVFIGSKKVREQSVVERILERKSIFTDPISALEGLFNCCYESYVSEQTYYYISPEQIEKNLGDQQLKKVRECLYPKPFLMFFYNYVCASQAQECDCKDVQTIGMPCRHDIFEAKTTGNEYTDLISSRWIIDKTAKVKKM